MARAGESTISLQQRLVRYLRTGTEGSFFLPGRNKAFRMFGNAMDLMIETGQGLEAVECVKRINSEKSYFKREPLLYFLAVASSSQNMEVKKAAYAIVFEVCENPVDLFTYLKHVRVLGQLQKGWGAGLRKVVCKWYNNRDPMVVAEFVTRYRRVGNWSHRDVFRLSHIKPANDSIAFLVKYVIKGLKAAKEAMPEPGPDVQRVITYLEAVERVKHSDDAHAVAMTLEEHQLTREHIPTPLLLSKEVWNSLLPRMTLTDTLGHLTSLARRGFLTIPGKGTESDVVVKEIQDKVLLKVKDEALIATEKISPFLIYITIRNYTAVFAEKKRVDKHRDGPVTKNKATNTDPVEQGKKKKKKKKKEGGEGTNNQVQTEAMSNPAEKATSNNPELFDALHKAFRIAVEKNMPTTDKRYLLAVKASVSELGKGIRGCPAISPLEVMALMATFYKKKEKEAQLGFFTASLTPMKYPSEVQDLIQEIGSMAAPVPNLACDPAAPISWALEKKVEIDVFLVMSDGNESQGEVSAAEKLDEYRQKMNLPNTKMVLCGLTAPRLDFAQSEGMFNIGGFDVTVPAIINRFVTDKLDQ